MKRDALVVPAALIVLSSATRFGVWLVVSASASVLAIWVRSHWQIRRWSPVAVALWTVAEDNTEGRNAAHVAVASFGDRTALQITEQAAVAPSAVGAVRAAGRLLNLMAVPDSTRPRQRTHLVWCITAAGAVLVSSATGSIVWLVVGVTSSTCAMVTWSWWRVVTQTRHEHVSAAATNRDGGLSVSAVIVHLVARSRRPDAVLAEAARVVERADLPPSERHRAAQRLDGVRPCADRRSMTPLAIGHFVAVVGVVTPWIGW